MGIFDIGLQELRDLFHDDLLDSDWGDSGAAFAVTQTGVQSPISGGTGISITKTKGTFAVQTNATLNNTTATGNTVRELSLTNGTISYGRSVFPGVSHTSSDDVVVIKTHNFKRGD